MPEPYNPPLLSCEPNIAVRLLSPHDSFVILASDGLFEYMSNQEAVDIVASSPRKVRQQGSGLLRERVCARATWRLWYCGKQPARGEAAGQWVDGSVGVVERES